MTGSKPYIDKRGEVRELDEQFFFMHTPVVQRCRTLYTSGRLPCCLIQTLSPAFALMVQSGRHGPMQS